MGILKTVESESSIEPAVQCGDVTIWQFMDM